ncbi:putative uncharacterized protein [Rhodococcus sp. AW25M09]|nr:putative uncharacterized protein [Rhodococcus sp. AW25M09]
MTVRGVTRSHLIWATRGRNWGFRFLLDAGKGDPLPLYERAFAELGDEPAAWHRSGQVVAVRFPDPGGDETQRDESSLTSSWSWVTGLTS